MTRAISSRLGRSLLGAWTTPRAGVGTLPAVAVCAVLVAASVLLAWDQRHVDLTTYEVPWLTVAAQVTATVVWAAGAVVLLRARQVSWTTLASIAALSHALAAFSYVWAVEGLAVGRSLPLAGNAYWFFTWLQPVDVAVSGWMIVGVPDGRFPTGWLRVPATLAVGGPALGVLASAAARFDVSDTSFAGTRNPLGGLDIPPLVPGLLIAPTVIFTLLVAVVRWRRCQGAERTAMRRVVLFCLVGLLIPVALVVSETWGITAVQVLGALLLLALVSIITRNNLTGIEPVLDRAVQATLLAGGVLAAYLALVGLLDALFGGVSGSFVAVVVALLAIPLRQYAVRWSTRFVYGDRDDPAAVVRAVLDEARLAVQPQEMLDNAVRRLAAGMRLDWVAVSSPDGEGTLAEVGTSPEPDGAPVESVELVHRGEVVGSLRAAPRAGEEVLTAADRRALGELAGPLAVMVDAAQSARALRLSRDRLVHVREEERRRLRRDLHDGLGPILTGVALTTDAARNLLDVDPAAAGGLLESARGELTDALSEVRRLVENLRPPALEDLGLIGALRQHAHRFPNLAVTVAAVDDLPALPAAVELVAYRVAAEAVTNAARHAGATAVAVRFHLHDTFDIDVTDDGPHTGPWRPGVGLRAMAERVAEVSGTLDAGPTPTGGRVAASLPLAP